MRDVTTRRAIFALVAVVLLVRFVVAGLAPIVQDEAYYLAWSSAPDLGYFDHPPAVAWLGASSLLAPSSAFAGRLGGLLAAALAIPFCVGLFRRAGLCEPRVLLSAIALCSFNLCGLACGILVVPDTLYFVAWCAALHEAAAALDGNPRRWLTAGVATGIGLLSKYMMVLMFPVLLIALLRGRARQLRTPWPWAGCLVALALFSPHLAWNARNDWIPMRFQLKHGFTGAGAVSVGGTIDLPALEDSGTAELALARQLGYEPPPVPAAKGEEPTASLRWLANIGSWVGSLALWWGALIIVVVGAVVHRLRRGVPGYSTLRPHVRPLLLASVLVPVVFFGIVSLRSRVEANWPAAYTVGACALLASYGAQHLRSLIACSAWNVVAIVLIALHARVPVYASNGDRILDETHGYRELADVVARTEGPVFVDRHQTTGMLRFHLPGREITQWPGLTRPSEFVRRREWNALTRADLVERGGFWLVAASILPPGIDGFRAVEMRQITVRAEGGRILTRVVDARDAPPPTRDRSRSIHRWHVIRYLADPVSEFADQPRSQ